MPGRALDLLTGKYGFEGVVLLADVFVAGVWCGEVRYSPASCPAAECSKLFYYFNVVKFEVF